MDQWGFAWYIRLHFNFDLLASLATFLFHSPTTTLAHRGWVVLESLYAKQSFLDTHRPKAAVTPSQFILKALSERERVLAEVGQTIEIPGLVASLKQIKQLKSQTPPGLPNAHSWTALESIPGGILHNSSMQPMVGLVPQTDAGEELSDTYEFWLGALWNAN